MTEREFLKSVPLFSRLGEASLDSILRLTRRRKFKKEDIIFHEKEVGDSLFVILHGRIKVAIFGDDGKEVTLSTLSEGGTDRHIPAHRRRDAAHAHADTTGHDFFQRRQDLRNASVQRAVQRQHHAVRALVSKI